MKKKLRKPKQPPLPQMDRRETPYRKTKRAETVLPPEVIEEILARLPVKSVLRLRSVSISWRCSIDSRFFVNKRLRSSAEWKVISNDTALDDPNKQLMKDSTFVGSCNGLLCILKQKSFFLWNPTTRISTELPKLDFQIPITKYGFGWDEGTDAYKVFVVVYERDQKIGKVYSSLTNSWKTVLIEHTYVSEICPEGLFLCGHIHWLTDDGLHIESFDLKSEVFRTMEQAFKPQPYMWLMETDGCLGILCDNNQTRLDVWVMKKYWVKESWVKQNTAPIPLECRGNNNYSIRLRSKRRVKFYPGKNVGNVVQYHYVESLVSPVYISRKEIEQEQVQGLPIQALLRILFLFFIYIVVICLLII